ncbi:MAG: hypothetical protein K2M69_08240 [Muribaculaceae bacterium]|nr:hypothetical protein [Muribaculaceae bacterium]
MKTGTTTALAIASSADNVAMIVRSTPEAYEKSLKSHDNCLAHCSSLLETILETGMTDELDQKAAQYIERSKNTVKQMKERRQPVTKLFDQVRKEFTTLENEVDPTAKDTVPYRLQQLRNEYAARKREEAERKRREEEARQQAEISRRKYREDCDEDYRKQFDNLIETKINELTSLNSTLTTENYQEVKDTLESYPVTLSDGFCLPSGARMPNNLTPDEKKRIRQESFESLMEQFREQHKAEIGDYRDELIERLPSRFAELERASRASAEEAERIKAEMQKREMEEASRQEAERIAREQEAKSKAEMQKANNEAADLFGLAQAGTQDYQPKVKVSKKIRLLNQEGFMQVLMMWWAKEGVRLSVEELEKAFKKQITFCEKLANKEGEFIKHSGVQYLDDVKAK